MNDAIDGLKTLEPLQIDDLAMQAVELSDEEIRAVSGGKWTPTWTSGASHQTDEWVP